MSHVRATKSESRSSITILVLGDEAVGKSSLISTFVSRHFSEVVPGIMTRVRLPPDPETHCLTTLVDSQGGDAALVSAATLPVSESTASLTSLIPSQHDTSYTSAASSVGTSASKPVGIDQVDSIILVYDLDRAETFYRLENHWLPLIERCYNGELPVIVAGNKMDLFRTGIMDEQALARSRQQIVSLMQRFRFIRQCIKCSAKNLLRVDEVFLKAQHAVLYPFVPLFDLYTGRLTDNCRRAFTRIFRIFDKDNDGLLSNAELDAFQYQTFRVPFVERDITGWKKVVSRNNPTEDAVVQDGKFTVAGFLAIFDVFISQNRLDLPWKVLRKFGYDNDLNLHIPEAVTMPSDDKGWKLSPSARTFLAAMFHQFDSDSDGILTADDVAAIFSIVPEPSLPPWHPIRAHDVLDGGFSMPKQKMSPASSGPGSPTSESAEGMALSQSLSASGITICSATSLPTVDISSLTPVSKPLSFLDWMGYWHMLSAISPAAARAELYRLGHVEDRKRKDPRKRSTRRKTVPSGADYSSVMLPSQEIRVLVLGSRGCGKTALLRALCEVNETETSFRTNPTTTTPTKAPETSSAYVKLQRETLVKGAKSDGDGEEFVVHLVFTEVPPAPSEKVGEQTKQMEAMVGPTTTNKSRAFDVVLFAFDCSNDASLAYALALEQSLLTDDVSRVFVATKADTVEKGSHQLLTATDHCASLDLEAPYVSSASGERLGAETESAAKERYETLSHLARCALQENGMCLLKSRPHAEQKRKEAAKRRKIIWLGGLVSVSVAVAFSVGVLWSGGSTGKGEKKDRLGWLRHLFG